MNDKGERSSRRKDGEETLKNKELKEMEAKCFYCVHLGLGYACTNASWEFSLVQVLHFLHGVMAPPSGEWETRMLLMNAVCPEAVRVVGKLMNL